MHSAFRGTTQGGLALRLEGELDIERLIVSLRAIQKRHEILRCVIERHDDVFCFVTSDNDVLPFSMLCRANDADWRKQLERFSNELISARCLWHVVLLTPDSAVDDQTYDILLFVHHAIMDGTAADTFLEDVLEHYVQSRSTPLQQIPLPPAAESAVPASMQLDWDEFVAWQRGIPNVNTSLALLAHHELAPLAKRHTLFETVELSAAQTAHIEQRAKSRGVTLNSWLSAALLSAVGKHTPSRNRLVLHSTFSLRRLCAPRIGATDIACCIAIISTAHDVPPAGMRELALEHQGALARAVLQQTKQPKQVRVPELSAGMKTLHELAHFTHDIAFTFGESRLKPQYGPLGLRHLYPVVNRSLGNIALAVHGVRLNGRCHFTFNHTAPLQPKSWAEQVRRSFVEALHDEADPTVFLA